ncbi:MAG: choice-of-anchor I family protein [Bacteroidota bacterium]
MKITICLGLLICSFTSFAQVITKWDFNSVPSDGSTSTGSFLPSSGTGTLTLIGGTTSTFAAGNSADPNSADNSGLNTTTYPASATNSETAGIQFNVPTTSFSNIVVEFMQRLSNTANNTYVLQYTLDNTAGVVVWATAQTFTFVPQATGTGDTWYTRSVDLSAISGLDNNPNAGFRLVSAFDPVSGNYLAARSTSSYSSGGTVRFDLITIREKQASVSIASANNSQIVAENAGTINIPITTADANTGAVELQVQLVGYSSATQGADFDWTNTQNSTIPAGFNGVTNFQININDDVVAERTETIIVKVTPIANALVNATNYYQIIYVKDNDYVAPTATNELNLSLLSSFSNGVPGSTSAEIVAYDSSNYRLFIANSIDSKLDIVDFANPSAPVLLNSIDISSYGAINSVAVHDGVVAMAIQNTNAQLNGFIVFLDENGAFINQVDAGAMPDMITFNKDFTKVITANEGEPSLDYSVDPEGSITIVDLTPGYAALTNGNTTTISLTSFNGQAAALLAQGVRIFSTSASVAQDLEPEYVAISDDNTKLYVTLQENNAMLVIDLTNNTILNLYALGTKDYSSNNDGMDMSDQNGQILITSIPVKGMYMPDAISYSQIGGQGYVFTANEGDSREFGTVIDAKRISATVLDPTAFPDQVILKNNKYLGRLNALQYSGDTDGDGDFDQIHVLGGRSFSVWNASTGTLVFDSKDLIEQVLATDPVYSQIFNASNTTGTPSLKNRSDDKGPEPEGIVTTTINGRHYLFVSLERIGGVMAFNIENPSNPIYVGYKNNRSLTGAATDDLGSEGIIHISADESPNGEELILLANEVSSTISVYQINTCAEVAMAEVVATQTEICAGDDTQLSIAGAATTTVQWFNSSSELIGENGNTLTVGVAGSYKVFVESSLYNCVDTSNVIDITVNTLPTVDAGIDFSLCAGEEATLQGSGAISYSWDNSITNGTTFTPTTTLIYAVTGTDANGCENTDDILVTVNSLPTVDAGTDFAICAGDETALTGTGTATTYTWDNSVIDGVDFEPTSTLTYSVAGTDANGCENTDDILVTVNSLPTVDAGTDFAICAGDEIALYATGTATTYTWDNSVIDGVDFEPTSTLSYTVTGTDANTCENTDEVEVTVHSLPLVSAGADLTVCQNTNVTFSGSGAVTYTWNNGVINSVAFPANAANTYIVEGIDVNGCKDQDTLYLVVNALPTVDAGVDFTVCEEVNNVTLNGSGAASYSWSNGVVNGVPFTQSVGTTNFTVTGTDANGCIDTDVITVVSESCVGLDELSIDVSVYPNPFNSSISIQTNESIQITLLDLQGKIVRKVSVEIGTATIDLNQLASGMYTMIIRNEKSQILMKKLIKE